MAKPTYQELQDKIAELANEINELRDPSKPGQEQFVKLHDELKEIQSEAHKLRGNIGKLKFELRKAEAGQDAMLKEAKRVSEELSDIRTNYVQVPRDMWEMIDQLPNLIGKARQAHPLLCSMNEVTMLTILRDRWNEVKK